MEIVVNLLNLCEVLVLHSATSFALGAVLGRIGEQNLVDYNVMDIDFLLGQLDSQSFSLVHGEELGDANGDKGCFGRVLELLVNILNFGLHGIYSIKHTLLLLFWRKLRLTVSCWVHHALHLAEHPSEFVLELNEFDEALLENVWEIEQAQGMSSRCSIENNQREIVLVERLHHLTEARSLVNTWH